MSKKTVEKEVIELSKIKSYMIECWCRYVEDERAWQYFDRAVRPKVSTYYLIIKEDGEYYLTIKSKGVITFKIWNSVMLFGDEMLLSVSFLDEDKQFSIALCYDKIIRVAKPFIRDGEDLLEFEEPESFIYDYIEGVKS